MANWQEVKSEALYLDKNDGMAETVGWSPDGQILSVSTSNGFVVNYLARMPTIHDSCGSRVGYVSSLREISVPTSPSVCVCGCRYILAHVLAPTCPTL